MELSNSYGYLPNAQIQAINFCFWERNPFINTAVISAGERVSDYSLRKWEMFRSVVQKFTLPQASGTSATTIMQFNSDGCNIFTLVSWDD